MKKIFTFCLVFLMMFTFVTSFAEEVTPTLEPTLEPTLVDNQNTDSVDYDQLLADAIIKITTADFYEPAAVRVLEIKSFSTKWFLTADYAEKECPWNVVVRLQGENRVGGTVNHYYKICIKSGYDTSNEKMIQTLEKMIKSAKLVPTVSSVDDQSKLQDLRASFGDYLDLGDNYSDFSQGGTNVFSIKNVNKALKTYWEDLGF